MKAVYISIVVLLISCSNSSNDLEKETKIEIRSKAKPFSWETNYIDSTFTKDESEDLKNIINSSKDSKDTSGIIEHINIK